MPLSMGELFAGIGGFSLGFRRASFEVKWQVEIEPFCRKVLERHFPEAERFEDVKKCGRHNLKAVDVICGGFPCQDISLAGDRAGIEGDTRSGLWGQMHRIICELRPRFAVVENVAALLVPVRDDKGIIVERAPISRVLGDLADAGYDAEMDERMGFPDLGLCSAENESLLLPTMRASMSLVGAPIWKREPSRGNLEEVLADLYPELIGMKLNILAGEWHMGFPINWTDSKPLAMP